MPAPSLLTRQIGYTYDNLNRLTSANYIDNSFTTYNFQYAYDLDSNRAFASTTRYSTAASVGNLYDWTQYTYNNADQLLSANSTSGTTQFAYNVDGQLTSQTLTQTGQTLDSYTYDTAGRLRILSDVPHNINLFYSYDGQNNRISKTDTGVTTTYLYDTTGQLPSLVGELPSNASATWYVPGVKPLGQDTNGIFSYFGYDRLGSVRELFSAGGIEQSLTNFDPYGQVLEQVSGVSSQLGFTGALTDESGFDYLNARTYDPAIDNFTSADPLENGNKYNYALDNPVNFIDPSGNDPIEPPPEPPHDDNADTNEDVPGQPPGTKPLNPLLGGTITSNGLVTTPSGNTYVISLPGDTAYLSNDGEHAEESGPTDISRVTLADELKQSGPLVNSYGVAYSFDPYGVYEDVRAVGPNGEDAIDFDVLDIADSTVIEYKSGSGSLNPNNIGKPGYQPPSVWAAETTGQIQKQMDVLLGITTVVDTYSAGGADSISVPRVDFIRGTITQIQINITGTDYNGNLLPRVQGDIAAMEAAGIDVQAAYGNLAQALNTQLASLWKDKMYANAGYSYQIVGPGGIDIKGP